MQQRTGEVGALFVVARIRRCRRCRVRVGVRCTSIVDAEGLSQTRRVTGQSETAIQHRELQREKGRKRVPLAEFERGGGQGVNDEDDRDRDIDRDREEDGAEEEAKRTGEDGEEEDGEGEEGGEGGEGESQGSRTWR